MLGSDSVAIYRAIFMKIAAFPATCVPGLILLEKSSHIGDDDNMYKLSDS